MVWNLISSDSVTSFAQWRCTFSFDLWTEDASCWSSDSSVIWRCLLHSPLPTWWRHLLIQMVYAIIVRNKFSFHEVCKISRVGSGWTIQHHYANWAYTGPFHFFNCTSPSLLMPGCHGISPGIMHEAVFSRGWTTWRLDISVILSILQEADGPNKNWSLTSCPGARVAILWYFVLVCWRHDWRIYMHSYLTEWPNVCIIAILTYQITQLRAYYK